MNELFQLFGIPYGKHVISGKEDIGRAGSNDRPVRPLDADNADPGPAGIMCNGSRASFFYPLYHNNIAVGKDREEWSRILRE